MPVAPPSVSQEVINSPSQLSQPPEEASDVLTQPSRLLKGGEVPSARHDRPPLDVITAFGPLSGRAIYLIGKDCDGAGDIDPFVLGQIPRFASVLVVEPSRGVYSLRHPVYGCGGKEHILGEAGFHVPAAVAPSAVLLHDPGSQSGRRVDQAVRKSLGIGALDM